MKKLLILGCALAALGCNDSQTIANDLHLSKEAVELASARFDSPQGASYSPTHSDYVNNLFGNVNPAGVDVNLGLPNYAYLQGLVCAQGNFFLAGQVRVIGGVIATGNVTVAGDGMVTTNPESQLNRVNVSQARWKVESWVQE